MNTIGLNVESVMRAYNWFHHAFPDYKNNEICTADDIELRNALEHWLIEQGK